MSWVRLSHRVFDLPDVGLGTYFRQLNQPNNPLGPGNPSGQPYRTETLVLDFPPGRVRTGVPGIDPSRREIGTGQSDSHPVPRSRRERDGKGREMLRNAKK